MIDLDHVVERLSRQLAESVSRRSLLRSLGGLLVGAASLPLLPVARGADSAAGKKQDPGDAASCDYWRYCAIDGFLCACCGGSVTVCPPGTEPAPITWVGTCRNAADGRDYIVSYNDCCGKASCGRCLCNRNEGDAPIYRPSIRTTTTGASAATPISPTTARFRASSASPTRPGETVRVALLLPILLFSGDAIADESRARQNYLHPLHGLPRRGGPRPRRQGAIVQAHAGQDQCIAAGARLRVCASRALPRRPWTISRRPRCSTGCSPSSALRRLRGGSRRSRQRRWRVHGTGRCWKSMSCGKPFSAPRSSLVLRWEFLRIVRDDEMLQPEARRPSRHYLLQL